MKFTTTVLLGGKTATGFAVPEEVVSSFNSGKRVPVYVTINSHTYRSTICKMGGDFMLPLAAENREQAAVKAGDEIAVELKLDKDPREVEIPEDLQAALDAEPNLKAHFEGLSFTTRKEHARALTDAKTAETRTKRLDKVINSLRNGVKP